MKSSGYARTSAASPKARLSYRKHTTTSGRGVLSKRDFLKKAEPIRKSRKSCPGSNRLTHELGTSEGISLVTLAPARQPKQARRNGECMGTENLYDYRIPGGRSDVDCILPGRTTCAA